jgi:hypothetical protein
MFTGFNLWKLGLQPLEDVPRIVFTAVVHHHQLELVVVLVHEDGYELLQRRALVAATHDNGHGQVMVRLHFLRAEGKTAEHGQMEEGQHHQRGGHQGEN